MYKTWTASAPQPEDLARTVEAHLNEFAEEVISVSYAVARDHHALVVYKSIDLGESREAAEEEVVALAERIIDDSQA